MAKIVFFCIPAHGHTNPTLGVVRELIARGHQVWYYSYDFLREKIESTGATFVSCDDFDKQQHLDTKDAARIGSDLAFSTQILVETTLALDDAVFKDMRNQQPDCIVADSMAVWGKAVALKLEIPFVSSTTTFAFNQHSAKVMKQSPMQLLRMLISMPKINRQIRRLQRRGYPIHSILDIISNDENTHTIVYTSPEFQPCADTFSEKYAFVGPSIRPPQTVVKKRREKLVYLSMGTVNNDMLPFYQRCIREFVKREEHVILSVGSQVPMEAFGPLPSHVEVHPYVDQIGVLSQADVFITHCGMNSVSEGLYFGVPLVLLPQTPEQEGVARRVLELGAGIRPKGLEPDEILQAVDKLLTLPVYRENAAAIAAGFRQCGGAKAAADKIEQVLTCP